MQKHVINLLLAIFVWHNFLKINNLQAFCAEEMPRGQEDDLASPSNLKRDFKVVSLLNIVTGCNCRVSLGALNFVSGDNSEMDCSFLNFVSGRSTYVALSALNSVSGDNAFLVGFLNIVSGEYADIFGFMNAATGDFSRARGCLNIVSGESAASLGCLNYIKGDRSVVDFGGFNFVSGKNCKITGFCNYVADNDVEFEGCLYFPFIPLGRAAKKYYKKLRYPGIPQSYFQAQEILRREPASRDYRKLLDLLQYTFENIKSRKYLATKIKSRCHKLILGYLSRYSHCLQSLCEQWPEDNELKECRYKIEQIIRTYQRTRLSEQQAKLEDHYQTLSELTCPLCFQELDPNEVLFSLNCSHVYHADCLESFVEQGLEKEDLCYCRCVYQKGKEGVCGRGVILTDMAGVCSKASTIWSLQKHVIRKIKSLRFCPHCSQQLIRERADTRFQAKCHFCDKEACFNCGDRPHGDSSCEERVEQKKQLQVFLHSLRLADRSKFGFCPHCRILVEKKDGCDSMICGQNEADKTPLGGDARHRGCGGKFFWQDRILLPPKGGCQSKE